MSIKILLSIGFLSVAGLFPLAAQDDEMPKVNIIIGGGLSIPINPLGRYVGSNGNVVIGGGGNFNEHNSIEGDFMWSGLSPNLSLLHPINRPYGNVNLYAVTTNYRFHIDKIAGSVFGIYLIGGGGWYYRHLNINKNYVVPPLTVCQPIYNWWGYACDTSSGYVTSITVASHGTSAGGLNAGAGITLKMGDSGWKFFVESRYIYAWSQFVPTTLAPLTFGFRFN